MSPLDYEFQAVVLGEKDSLQRYRIVKTTHFYKESIVFNVEGCVVRFKVNNPSDKKNHNKTFILLNRSDLTSGDEYYDQNDLEKGFYDEALFYEYHKESHDTFIISVNMHDLTLSKYDKFVNANPTDIIYFAPLQVLKEEENGLYGVPFSRDYYLTWIYLTPYSGQELVDNEFGEPDKLIFGSTPTHTFTSINEDTDIDVVFYDGNIHQANKEGLNDIERYQVAKAIVLSAVTISNITSKIFSLLPSHVDIDEIVEKQLQIWKTPDPGIFVDKRPIDIVNYKNRLINFYFQALADKLIIDSETTLRALWRLLACLDAQTIGVFALALRVEFLSDIVRYGKLDDPIDSWEPVDMEYVVRDIIFSVEASDASTFLDALLIKPIEGDRITIFEYIFNETNDIGFGEDALKDILDHIYYLWMNSKYAYYENGIPENTSEESRIDQLMQFMANDFTTYNESTVTTQEYTNKAPILNYKSEEFLGFFHDTSHDFAIVGEHVVVLKDDDSKMFKSFPYEMDKTKVYHIFQGVTVLLHDNESSNELKLRFKQYKVNGQASSIVPIFYLAYIDYNKTIENIVTTVEITLDAIFAISGIGNILKLRHLFKLTKLGRYALTGESIAETIFVQLAKATLEIAPTVAGYYVDYQMNGYNNYCDEDSPNYNHGQCEWYKQFSHFLLLIQIKSGVIEGTHQAMIRKSAKQLSDDVNNLSPEFNALMLDTLRMFAYDLETLENVWKERLYSLFGTYNSNVWQRYTLFPDEQTKMAFILDFENASFNDLKTLGFNNGSLMDEWEEIYELIRKRNDVDYLKAYRKIKNAEDLNIEVFSGLIEPPIVAGGKWTIKGAHYKSAFIGGFDGGFVRVVKVPDPNNPLQLIDHPDNIDLLTITDASGNSYTYYQRKVEFFHQDFVGSTIDPLTELPTKFKRKIDVSTFFPDEWSEQKVLEEIAFAYQNSVKDGPRSYLGTMSDGVQCMIYTDGFGNFVSAHPSIKIK